MRLLVTRAAREAGETARILRERGHEVLVSPVLEMRAAGAFVPTDPFDAVLVTSGQALRVLTQGQVNRISRLPLWVVGSRTAAVALDRGLRAPAVVAEDVAKLAATLREAGDSFRNVLYLAGQDRKPDLESACEAMGLTVRTAVLYEALAAQELSVEARAALISGSIDGVLHFSRRSVALFLTLADEASLADRIGGPLIHWCLSADVAKPLAARGLETRIAQKPDATALFDLIETG